MLWMLVAGVGVAVVVLALVARQVIHPVKRQRSLVAQASEQLDAEPLKYCHHYRENHDWFDHMLRNNALDVTYGHNGGLTEEVVLVQGLSGGVILEIFVHNGCAERVEVRDSTGVTSLADKERSYVPHLLQAVRLAVDQARVERKAFA